MPRGPSGGQHGDSAEAGRLSEQDPEALLLVVAEHEGTFDHPGHPVVVAGSLANDSGRTHAAPPHFHFQAMKRHRPTAI
jgi:hypothetical protein